MRELPVTIVLSVLVHVAGIAWLASRDVTERPRAAVEMAPRVEALLPTLPSTEVEVALLDDDMSAQLRDAPAPAIVVPRTPPRSQPRARSHVTATTQTTNELPPRPPETTTTENRKPSILSMRTGPDIGGKIHRPGSEGISDATLERMAKGEFESRIANLPGTREDAAYERAQAKLHSQRFADRATPDDLTAARLDRMAARDARKNVELGAQSDGTYTSDKTTFKATVNPDGTVKIRDKGNWHQVSLFYAEFDVGDALMRSRGMDPYASAKLAYLDRTRDQRVEIGKRHGSSQLAQSAKIIAANLGRLWSTVNDPVERKELLFALWDECAETGDDELVAGGAEARRVLINFMQAKHVAYSVAELSALNAKKRSRATFAP